MVTQRTPQRSSRNKRSATAPSAAQSQLRIIGGQWRGRKLDFYAVDGLRPTPDRVRETLFNWLQPYLPGARCLDLFSGTGALGIEALSRGATAATFVDLNRTSAQQLQRNLQVLNAQDTSVIEADVQQWLAQNSVHAANAPYDLVFLDPPFRKDLVAPCCEWLEKQQMLSNNAVIYIETEAELQHLNLPQHWREHRYKKAGQVSYRLYFRETKL